MDSIKIAYKKNKTESSQNRQVFKAFHDFIIGDNHPCVMAQSVFTQDQAQIHTYSDFGSKKTSRKILQDLKNYLTEYDFETNDFYTFIAAFPEENALSERLFEAKLWSQLQHLHEEDEQPWDKEVSNDPAHKEFSFSIAGKAFYMVGLHPNSSRIARQSPYPALVFNLHWQFEKLREMGAYQNVKEKIRERDREWQGDNNPMLEDFGENSEARQYSGRSLPKDWVCPFSAKK